MKRGGGVSVMPHRARTGKSAGSEWLKHAFRVRRLSIYRARQYQLAMNAEKGFRVSECNVRRGLMIAALSVLAASAMPAMAQGGDAVKGKAVFMRCAICHSVDPGVNRIGPSLSGLFGSKAGVGSFAFSPAMTAAKITWNAKTLDAFVTKPSAVVPGTKMMFAGISNPDDRANLIAYLGSATKPK
jgi:cytochrome c